MIQKQHCGRQSNRKVHCCRHWLILLRRTLSLWLAEGRIGLIASISQPFCGSCNRFRITADGKLRHCLFSLEETDINALLRSEGPDDAIALSMISSIAAKKEGHEINKARFLQPSRPMYSIGE